MMLSASALVEERMAVTFNPDHDVLSVARSPQAQPATVDVTKLLVWIAAAIGPWTVVIGIGRLLIAVLS